MSVKSKIVGILRSVYGIFVSSGAVTFREVSTSGFVFENQAGADLFTIDNNGTVVVTNNLTANGAVVGTTGVYVGGGAGFTTSAAHIVAKKTGIADNTATAVFTVTVPNGNHAAAIRVHAIGSSGGADAFESTATLEGNIVVARTTGANAVVTAAAAALTGTATVAAGAALTSFAYGVSAVAGAAGATNTFDITVTINDSGNLGSNQCVMLAECINAESNGVSMAAA
jgi:hypothetical protein